MGEFFDRGRRGKKPGVSKRKIRERRGENFSESIVSSSSGGIEVGGFIFEKQPRERRDSEALRIMENYGSHSICGYARNPQIVSNGHEDSFSGGPVVSCFCALNGGNCNYSVEEIIEQGMEGCQRYNSWLDSLDINAEKKCRLEKV
jgi:hypothetical protein